MSMMYALWGQLRFNSAHDEDIDDFAQAMAAESERALGRRLPALRLAGLGAEVGGLAVVVPVAPDPAPGPDERGRGEGDQDDCSGAEAGVEAHARA